MHACVHTHSHTLTQLTNTPKCTHIKIDQIVPYFWEPCCCCYCSGGVGVIGSGPTTELEWENETRSAPTGKTGQSLRHKDQGRKGKGMVDGGRGAQKGAGRMVMYS